MRLVADILLLVGGLFALLGALGLLRMPVPAGLLIPSRSSSIVMS